MKQDVITDQTVERVERKLRILRDLIHEDDPLDPDDPRAVQRFTLNEADVEVEMSIRANDSVVVHIDAGDTIETAREVGGTEFDTVASDLYFVLDNKENYGFPKKQTETGDHRAYRLDVEPVTTEEEWEDAHEEAFDN